MTQLDISKLRAVLFDWDNTLAESRSSLVIAVNRVLKEYHLPEWEISKQKRDTNLSFKDNFPRIFGDKAYEAYERYREIYKSIAASRITAFPSAKEVIEFFKSRGITVMIVTNKERCLLEYELPLLYKKKDFAKIVCGHEAPRDKPHGDQALFALKGFINREEISPETVWIVGDSPQDSNSALEINALPIRINQSIWGDEGQKEDKIVYFSGFPEFLSALKLAKN